MSADSTNADLEVIAQAVNNHIRFEERQLFNEIEKVVPHEELRNLLIEEHSVSDQEWKDEFWTFQI